MAIGRTEDRHIPWDPAMLQHRHSVWNPIRITHLGQRSTRPHKQAGHMIAIDHNPSSCAKILAERGPSTHGSRLSRL